MQQPQPLMQRASQRKETVPPAPDGRGRPEQLGRRESRGAYQRAQALARLREFLVLLLPRLDVSAQADSRGRQAGRKEGRKGGNTAGDRQV